MSAVTYRHDDGFVTRVSVVRQDEYDGGEFEFGTSYEDGSLNMVIDSLNAIRDSIPEQYRDIARCEITSVSGYEDSSYARIEVDYMRPATADEIAALLERERAAKDAERAREIALMERLRAKYETAN